MLFTREEILAVSVENRHVLPDVVCLMNFSLAFCNPTEEHMPAIHEAVEETL